MNRKLISYWIATGVVCLVFTGGGIANLFHADTQREIMEKLGYPAYLMTLLGVAKLLAVLAILAPGRKMLKEWAYAGLTFDSAANHGRMPKVHQTQRPTVARQRVRFVLSVQFGVQ